MATSLNLKAGAEYEITLQGAQRWVRKARVLSVRPERLVLQLDDGRRLTVPPSAEKRASPVVAWSASREPGTTRAAATNSRPASAAVPGPAAVPCAAVAVSTTGGFWKPPVRYRRWMAASVWKAWPGMLKLADKALVALLTVAKPAAAIASQASTTTSLCRRTTPVNRITGRPRQAHGRHPEPARLPG